MQRKSTQTLIIGAGIAGLSCARALAARGHEVRVLDKGRSVGGRCASWRSDEGLVLDYGVGFLHGSSASFVAELATLADSGWLEGWPRRVHGRGTACQPRAFAARETRGALRSGVSVWPKRLAEGLDVTLSTEVVSLERGQGRVSAVTTDGTRHDARELVVTLPCEQVLALLERSPSVAPALAGTTAVLRMLGTVPCLTLLATYPRPEPELGWDAYYPEQSEVLQVLMNESSKRPDAPVLGLVLQARAGWSRERLEQPVESWTRELLEEAALLLGPWAARPSWARPHRWRYARTDLSSELAGPALVEFEDGTRLGVAGELFARGAGLEAAWLSGQAMAERLQRPEGARSAEVQ